jgi:hypothetical protein
MGRRHAVTKKSAAAYRRGSRPEKSRIPDQLVELTAGHDRASAALRAAETLKVAWSTSGCGVPRQ